MPFSTIAFTLLLCSLSCGCRPFVLRMPELASPVGNESDESSDDTEASEKESDGDKAESADASDTSESAAPPVALGQGEWMLRVAPPGEQLEVDSLRWRNIPLEEALAQPKAEQPDFTRWLKHKSKSVSANAAIAAARRLTEEAKDPPPLEDGNENQESARANEVHLPPVVAALTKTVRAGELKIAQRRAAIEALGRLPGEEARQAVFALADHYTDFAGEKRNVYNPELHVELLSALAQQPDEQAVARFVAAIPCRAVEVRLAAVQNWPVIKDTVLSPEVITLGQDPDPRVRCACLKLAARCQHERALHLAQRSINDLKYEVRLAAVEAMESIPGEAAREELTRLSKHPTEGLRAAAIKALAKREAWEPALLAAEDEVWQVRLVLAGELARLSTPAAVQAAQKMLDDTSIAVQQKTVESLGNWPLARSGALLLDALDSPVFQTRKTAAKVFSDQWGAAATFPFDADEPTRTAAMLELRQKWETEFPAEQLAAIQEPVAEAAASSATTQSSITPAMKQQVAADLQLLGAKESSEATKAAACTRLVNLSAELPVTLLALVTEQKITIPDEVFLEVLPEVEPEFKHLVKLATADATARRQAVIDLRQHLDKAQLSDLALLRLVDLVVAESDPNVWHEVQQLLEADLRDPVVRLQYAALNHPTVEVQRRACLYLGKHGDARHGIVLSAALSDDNPQVVRAAATALGELERIDNTLPLVRLQASRDRELVLIVSSSLARQGEECGGDGLERAALDVDANLRRRAIETMAELKQARFVPVLVRALDDQLGIKQTALNGLVATTGQDIGRGSDETAPPMAEQIHRWKQWHAKQQKSQSRNRR